MRPAELSRSDTPSLPVAKHAVEFLERGRGKLYDWILLLQPTSPLRTAGDILDALALAEKPDTTAVIAVTSANNGHPLKLRLIEDGVLKYYLKTARHRRAGRTSPMMSTEPTAPSISHVGTF